MNDNDKPIGAPSLQTEAQQDDQNHSQQQPPKPKRKLNWKGFGIGIIAVIIIEFFAISMLQQGDPQITPPPPEPTKPIDKPTQTLVTITQRGGLCPQGDVCATSTIVNDNGSVVRDDKEVKKLSADQVTQLKKFIAETDIEAIKKTPFSGTCPIAFDGQETVYVIYKGAAKEEIPSCKYQVDENAPLFKFLSTNVGS